MTPPDSGEREYPCPHGRATWRMCPHCLGLNAPVPDMVITEDVQVSVVVISKSLAQRILAALELHGASGCDHCEACARDLRAAVGRKP